MKKLWFNFLKKIGILTREDYFEVDALSQELDRKILEAEKTFENLMSDYRALYLELTSDIKRVDNKIKNIKPHLKVDDPETKAFIKGILGKHDNKINNMEYDIGNKIIELKGMSNQCEHALQQAKEAIQTVHNIFNGLGLHNPNDFNDARQLIVEGIKKAREKGEQLG